MSIGRLVFMALGLIGGVAMLLVVGALVRAQEDLRHNLVLQSLAISKSDWFDGTVALSFERSVTQVAFALDDPAPQGFVDLIQQQRELSDRLLDQTVARLQDTPQTANIQTFLTRITADRARVEALRAEVDTLLRLPGNQRDNQRTSEIPYEIKSLIERLFSASAFLRLADGESSSEETVLSIVQNRAWEVREYGGRARTYYAIATLTGAPIPDVLRGEAAIDTARAMAAWAALRTETETLDLPQALLSQIADADRAFSGTYLAALNAIDAAMDAPGPDGNVTMPMGFEEFFEVSNQALDSVAALAPAAGLLIEAYWQDNIAESRFDRVTRAAVTLALLVVLAGTFLAVHRKVSLRLAATVDTLASIADGDLDRTFETTTSDLSELRHIADGLSDLTLKLRASRDDAAAMQEKERRAKEGVIGELMNGLERMAQGDLTHVIPAEAYPAYANLVTNYNQTGANLRSLVSGVIETAGEIVHDADVLRTSIGDLSGRTERQAASIAETARNLDQFSQSLSGMADNALKSDGFVSQASERAMASGGIVDGAIGAMERIRSSTAEIHRFTNVIDDIAFQTGLLALNAGVEAARAGESGKGFAVVASEIRDLSQRASDSATEIKTLVDESAGHVASGSDQVQETGSSLQKIREIVETVREGIGEISATSQSQSAGVRELGDTMDTIDEMTRQNATMVDDVTATSASLQEQARVLRSLVDRFVVEEDPRRAAA